MTQTETKATALEAVTAVMADLTAVAKDDRNESQGFRFRGIDAVVNAVGPILRRHKVVCAPMVEGYEYGSVEVGKNRTPMGHARVTVRYRWYGPAGDSFDSVACGEAMDSGDKATAKAMSVAWRTCLLQTLALPTDEVDPDHDIYERAPASNPHKVTDLDTRILLAKDADGLRELWREVKEAQDGGEVSREDAALLGKKITERQQEVAS